MEQFVLVSLSVYNNSSNNPTIVTKPEPPIYEPYQNLTYQKNTLKKEINQHLISSATPLLNKNLEFLRIKLSNSKTIVLVGIKASVLLKRLCAAPKA